MVPFVQRRGRQEEWRCIRGRKGGPRGCKNAPWVGPPATDGATRGGAHAPASSAAGAGTPHPFDNWRASNRELKPLRAGMSICPCLYAALRTAQSKSPGMFFGVPGFTKAAWAVPQRSKTRATRRGRFRSIVPEIQSYQIDFGKEFAIRARKCRRASRPTRRWAVPGAAAGAGAERRKRAEPRRRRCFA